VITSSVFALSFSTLLFELSLSRWLAIAHWGHMQTLWLLAAYLNLALPFFFAGLGASLAYVTRPERSGRISCAAMGGSGAGAACAMLAIPAAGMWPDKRGTRQGEPAPGGKECRKRY
jgi:hypothetical protein